MSAVLTVTDLRRLRRLRMTDIGKFDGVLLRLCLQMLRRTALPP